MTFATHQARRFAAFWVVLFVELLATAVAAAFGLDFWFDSNAWAELSHELHIVLKIMSKQPIVRQRKCVTYG